MSRSNVSLFCNVYCYGATSFLFTTHYCYLFSKQKEMGSRKHIVNASLCIVSMGRREHCTVSCCVLNQLIVR